MNNNKQENEALRIFTQTPEQFPMVHKCINSQSLLLNAANQINEQEPVLKVIWAGKLDEKNNRIICQMTAQEGYVAKSYLASIVDKEGNIVTEEAFVCFDQNMAFSTLTIPRTIFADCSVRMKLAVIDPHIRSVSKTIPLDNFDVEDIDAEYEISAPVVTRKGEYDRINISYYASSSKSSFDYVYPGTISKQMYFPSSGRITIRNTELKNADMKLTVSDGKVQAEYPMRPDIIVEDDTITYSFNEEWTGIKLSDCYKKEGSAYTHADYLLTVEALKTDDHKITLLITNIDAIIKGKKGSSIKEIKKIDVYLDCFAKGTQISMADGSVKAVENICSGDLIKTKDGRESRVRQVQVQDDCQVLGIGLESGRELSLTDGHAVYTKDGIFPASRLKEGQEVITETGTDRIRHIVPQCESTYRVYALFLEGSDEWLFADGVMVHSSDSGEVFNDRDWVREDLPEEWHTDYDNALKAGLIYGRC